MSLEDSLPFEFPYRWDALRGHVAADDEAIDYMGQRDRDLEDFLKATQVPLVFHWPTSTADWVGVRNGPGEFRSDGSIYMIRYRWDTPPLVAATVTWRLNNVLEMTHTVAASAEPHVEMPAQPYAQETIVSVVTSADSTASGLSAFLYFLPTL